MHSLGSNDIFFLSNIRHQKNNHSNSYNNNNNNSNNNHIVLRELFNFLSKDRTGFVPFEVDSPRQTC